MTSKNRLLAAACAALMLLTALVLFPPAHSRAESVDTDKVLRLHVLAASDSEEDQRVKLAVRDALLARMKPCSTRDEAEAFVLENGAMLLAAVEATLSENGMPYGAQLMLGESDFPDRSYGGVCYPAGRYYALRVLLGAGAGHNWWCVLFPPLCIVTRDSEPLPAADDIRFESTLARWLRARRDAS